MPSKPKKPPSIVFYGKDGSRNDVLLHEFGEGKFMLVITINPFVFYCWFLTLVCNCILLSDIDIAKLQGYLNSDNKLHKRTSSGDLDSPPDKKPVVNLDTSTIINIL